MIPADIDNFIIRAIGNYKKYEYEYNDVYIANLNKHVPKEIGNCITLTKFLFVDSKITDISCLSNCRMLDTVYLPNNQITDISCLSNCKMLDCVCLQNNKIEDISCLLNCSSLTESDFENNRIADRSVIDEIYLACIFRRYGW